MQNSLDAYNLKNIVEERIVSKTQVTLRVCKLYYLTVETDFETRILDFHKVVPSFLKIQFAKDNPVKVVYRDYKNFRNAKFRAELDVELSKHFIILNMNNSQFFFLEILGNTL